jgi:hypothetical protein
LAESFFFKYINGKLFAVHKPATPLKINSIKLIILCASAILLFLQKICDHPSHKRKIITSAKNILKVVTNEKRGRSRSWQVFEYGTGPWRSMSVYFLNSCRLFFKIFPFPVCKAQLIGNWNKNRQGGPKCTVRLFLKLFLYGTWLWTLNPNNSVHFLCSVRHK